MSLMMGGERVMVKSQQKKVYFHNFIYDMSYNII